MNKVTHIDELGSVIQDLNEQYENGNLQSLIVLARDVSGEHPVFISNNVTVQEAVYMLEMIKTSLVMNVLTEE